MWPIYEKKNNNISKEPQKLDFLEKEFKLPALSMLKTLKGKPEPSFENIPEESQMPEKEGDEALTSVMKKLGHAGQEAEAFLIHTTFDHHQRQKARDITKT